MASVGVELPSWADALEVPRRSSCDCSSSRSIAAANCPHLRRRRSASCCRASAAPKSLSASSSRDPTWAALPPTISSPIRNGRCVSATAGPFSDRLRREVPPLTEVRSQPGQAEPKAFRPRDRMRATPRAGALAGAHRQAAHPLTQQQGGRRPPGVPTLFGEVERGIELPSAPVMRAGVSQDGALTRLAHPPARRSKYERSSGWKSR